MEASDFRTQASLDLTLPAELSAAGIALRPVVPGDTEFLRTLYGTQRAAELAPVPWDDAAKDAFIDQQFSAQQAHFAANRPFADFLVVTRAAAPVGRLYIDRSIDPWRLAELALVSDARGAGIGAALVRWIAAAARDDGASGIDLHVAIDNGRAEAFYVALGFVAVPSSVATHKRLLRAS